MATFESRWEGLLPGLATKSDVADAKAAIAAVKADVADTKAAIAIAEGSIVKWLSGIILAMFSVAVGILLFAINRITPPVAPQAAQPIIVYPAAPAK